MECAVCKTRENLQRHHMYSRTKLAVKLYGKLIDDPRNIQVLCANHHLNHPVDKDDEITFCKKLGITPRSKCAKLVWERLCTSKK